MAGGKDLTERSDLKGEGYTTRALQGGDYLVRVRHLTSNQVTVAGS
jgi:hypothetical protein